jgi:osmoprotectant transport system ATP-binding protein
MPPSIEFIDAGYSIPQGKALLAHLDLAIAPGETVVLLGRSGSGKTTTLKLINGLLTATSGEVKVEGTPLSDWDRIKLRRRIGYAIQDVGLFPHYTVFQNVALVPKLENWPSERITARVREVLQLVGLPPEQFASRYPHQLSGGQRQRIGLARALAVEPPFLLMDEPFGALDPITRSELQREFKALQQRMQKTIVFVTHDITEALLLADRIGLIEQGRLQGIYTPPQFLDSDDKLARAYLDIFREGQEAFRG